MKPDRMTATAQDRLATWDEVRRATSMAPDRLVELCRPKDDYCQMDSDLGGIIRYPTEEFEFFAHLSDSDETPVN
jgi:hypothetical protein